MSRLRGTKLLLFITDPLFLRELLAVLFNVFFIRYQPSFCAADVTFFRRRVGVVLPILGADYPHDH